MSRSQQSDQVTELVRRLSEIPGSGKFSITVKQYPRFGPAESGSGYQKQVWSFQVQEGRADLNVPEGADEVIVSLQGAMPPDGTRSELLSRLSRLVNSVGSGTEWDYRFRTRGEAGALDYQIDVFTAVHAPPDFTLGDGPMLYH